MIAPVGANYGGGQWMRLSRKSGSNKNRRYRNGNGGREHGEVSSTSKWSIASPKRNINLSVPKCPPSITHWRGIGLLLLFVLSFWELLSKHYGVGGHLGADRQIR